MKHWTKLRRDIVGSERMQTLLETNPLAYALYINAKAVCDDYGRIEGSPRKLKGRVAPMASLSLADVEQAIRAMEECGVVRSYQVGGDQYLEIAEYNKVEETDWRNVGRPEFPAPPWWEVPQALQELLDTSTDSRIKPSRYGLPVDGPSGDGRATVGRRSSDGRYARESEAEAEVETTQRTTLAAPADPQPQTPREDTPAQAAANACLALYGITHETLTGPAAGSYYKAMNKLIGDLEHGAEELQAWATAEAVFGGKTLGNGSKPERAIPAAVRKSITAATWQQSFAKAKGQTQGNGGLWQLLKDGTRQYERNMDEYQVASIRLAIRDGTWDTERGLDRTDPRHPDCPEAIRKAAGL